MSTVKKGLEEKGIKQTWLAKKLGKSCNMAYGYVQNRQQPRLEVLKHEGYSKVKVNGTKKINFKVSKTATVEDKSRIMREWYRKQLKIQIPPLIDKWEKIIGVKTDDWGVKQMKTKWGACNVDAKRIWLNLELSKKPPICLEYILVHELVHLLERNHNDRFIALMNEFMPKWRLHRNELNSLPIVHNDWGY
ncbi:MAG: putative metal-dependent hydrolase [Patiriisocius sp.]|jgi:predicted metal-dependent hydrolase